MWVDRDGFPIYPPSSDPVCSNDMHDLNITFDRYPDGLEVGRSCV